MAAKGGNRSKALELLRALPRVSLANLQPNDGARQRAGGQTFPFPETEETVELGSFEYIQNKFMEDEKQRKKDDPRQGGVSRWFGL